MDKQNGPRVEEPKTFAQKLNDFIAANRILFLSVLGAITLIVIVLAAWSLIRGAAAEKSMARIELLAEDYATWSAEQDAAKKTELEKSLLAGLDEVIAKWPAQFAAQRALATRARIAEEKKDWAAAEKDWAEIATRAPRSFMAPIALQNAAVAAEEKGDAAAAVTYLESFLKDWDGKAPGSAHVFFSLGRIAEGQGDWSTAMGRYDKLVASYPDDDWTKLARDRIIKIKSQGLAK